MNLIFSGTFGQNRAKAFAENSLKNGSFPQAVLVYGEPGIGQFSFISELSEHIICSDSEKRPCGLCKRCQELFHQKRDNQIKIFPLAEKYQKSPTLRAEAVLNKWEQLKESPYSFQVGSKEHISIAQVRDLKAKLAFSEEKGVNRVILIYAVEAMQDPAANALLKILEEPPPNIYFLLSSERKERILPTILSRCIQLALSPLSPSELKAFAASQSTLNKVAPDTIGHSIRFANGSPKTQLYLCSPEGNSHFQLAVQFLQSVCSSHYQNISQSLGSESAFMSADETLAILRICLSILRTINRYQIENIPLNDIANLKPVYELMRKEQKGILLRKYLETCVSNLQKYAKPDIALLGGYLQLQHDWEIIK